MSEMKQCIGIMLINALSMTRLEYNAFRGWELPDDENGDDEGFLVEYVDGGKGNTEQYAGYVSWSPADVFARAYRPVDGMSFGLAIEMMKKGAKVKRQCWDRLFCFHEVRSPGLDPFIALNNGESVGTWVPQQYEILADDWMIVE